MVKLKDVIYYHLHDNADIYLFCMDRIKVYKVDVNYLDKIQALSAGCNENCIDCELMQFLLTNNMIIRC